MWIPIEFIFKGYALSLVIRYLFTFALYFIISRKGDLGCIRSIILIVSITSLFVSLELLHENYYARKFNRPTAIQKKFAEYITKINENANDFIPTTEAKLRPDGIIEFNHSTAEYIGIGVLASLIFYLLSNCKIYLLIMCIDITALLFSGARIPLLGTMIGFAAILPFIIKDQDLRYQLKGIIQTFSLLSIILVYIIFKYWQYLRTFADKIYIPVLLRGEFSQLDVWADMFADISGILTSMLQNPWVLFFGTGGPASLSTKLGLATNEWFFFGIFTVYGIPGGILLYMIFFIALKHAGIAMRCQNTPEKLLTLFGFGTLIIILIGLLHSMILLRKAIFPLFLLSLGIIRWATLNVKHELHNKFLNTSCSDKKELSYGAHLKYPPSAHLKDTFHSHEIAQL
jgi:hypothetical protein